MNRLITHKEIVFEKIREIGGYLFPITLIRWRPHPVVFYAFSIIAGILSQTNDYSILALILFLSILYYVRREYAVSTFSSYHILAMILLACFGYARTLYILNNHSHIQTTVPKTVSNGRFSIYGSRAVNNPRYNYCLYAHLVSSDENSFINNLPLLLYLQCDKDIHVGDTITFPEVKITKPRKKEFNLFLAKEGLYATSFIEQTQVLIEHKENFHIPTFISHTITSIKKIIKSKMNSETFALFNSLFLGHKSYGPKQMSRLKQKFRVWGVEHYLARSGLHVTILTMAWGTIFTYIPLWFGIKLLILFLTVVFYAIITGFSISFLRAVFTFFLYKILTASYAQINTTHVLALVACWVLIVNPLQLFFLDFQLSFLLTAALIWIASVEKQKRLILTFPNY